MKYSSKDKMVFYSFWMTILIVVYHLAPHLTELSTFNQSGNYLRRFFETFGPIALNYFFAVSAYKFFVSEKSCREKLIKRLKTLIVPFVVWNTIYSSLYILQNGLPDFEAVILGYTLTPFDGPLWYIFVLYGFFVFSSVCMSCLPWLFKRLECKIVILSFIAAVFHHAVSSAIVSFPFDWWVERALRMVPPFLYGVYCSEHKPIGFCMHSATMWGGVATICLSLSIAIGNNIIITLLLYLCTFSLWNILPQFTLKADSIIQNDMFTVYSAHEGIIIALLALLNKRNVVLSNFFSFIIALFFGIALVVIIGFVLNMILSRLPAIIDIMFTGGRNVHRSK